MADERNANSYEESRKQRLLENKKRIEDLGLLKLAKNLSDVKRPKKSQPQYTPQKPTNNYLIEPRRSSRPRNNVPSYRDDVDIELPTRHRRSKLNSSWASYLARPVEEVKTSTYEERARAYKYAEKLQSNLQSGNPSFVKSMVRSHVYSCFWLGLPGVFCKRHLPKSTVDMVLENEEGTEYEAIFISKRTGLSGGWRAFALDHKLDDGDALVFELIEPTRFKVYIVRAFGCEDQDDEDDEEAVPNIESDAEETSNKKKKIGNHQINGSDAAETSEKETNKRKEIDNYQRVGSDAEQTSKEAKTRKKNDQKSQPVSALRRSLRNKGN